MAGKKSGKSGGGKYHDLALTLTSVLVIAGVLCLQVSARKLKKWSEGQRHASDVLEASERELTVLGVIAFALFVLEEVAHNAKGEWYDVFHEVHFALFTVAVFYVGINVLLYKMSSKFGRRWRAYEESDLVDHKATVDRVHQLRRELKIKPLDNHLFFGSYWIWGLSSDPFAWFEYQTLLEAMSFHEIRRDFLRSQQLPHEFEFASYLEKCMQHVCIQFSEIRDSVWIFGVLLLVVHSYVTTLTTHPEMSDILLWLSVAVVALGFLVFLKVKWIYWYVLHSEVIYHGGEHTGAPKIQRSLFWFGNPGLVITLLEVCLFVLATTFSILVFNLRELAKKNALLAPLFAFIVAAALLFFLLPRILPRFTLITHVGEMTDPRRLAETVTKQQHRGALGYEKAQQLSSRRSKTQRKKVTKALSQRLAEARHYAWETMVEAPAISTLSALLAIAYVFAIAVTLDEAGARAVIGNGGVIAVRSIELGLSGFFITESTLRLAWDTSSMSRILDSINCCACATMTTVQHVLWHTSDGGDRRLVARVLHAASVTILLRVFNTAWHREVVEPRFEHIRCSPEELLKTAPKRRDEVGASEVFGSKRSLFSVASSTSVVRVADMEGSDEPVIMDTSSRSLRRDPSWLAFYTAPTTGDIVKTDDRGMTVQQAEALVHELVLTAFETLQEDDTQRSAVVLARAALEQSLTKVDDAVAGSGVTSTAHEVLEDSLYFNRVLRSSVVSVVRLEKRLLSLSFFSSEGSHDVKWQEVKLLLTRDQILYYRIDSMLSEIVGEKGVRHVAASTSDPRTVALDAPGCHAPQGRLHLTTILKIEVKDSCCICTTTAHVYKFAFAGTDEAKQWKTAIEDAVDREDDDDPVHPMMQHKAVEDMKDELV